MKDAVHQDIKVMDCCLGISKDIGVLLGITE